MADGAADPDIVVADGARAFPAAAWDAIANPPGAPFDPFLSHAFLAALEDTGCVGEGSGWTPQFLAVREQGRLVAAMPLYLKSHSYGEYVFDHAWADALSRAGGRYYPKLQCAVPFTPVTGRRLLAATDDARRTLIAASAAALRQLKVSSLHVTFAADADIALMHGAGFLRRVGLQYHWFNRGYDSFAAFLAALTSAKRKTIRRERERANADVTVRCLQGDDIRAADWDFFFRCYMDTGSRKWGSPYLNRDFFHALGARMADRCVLFVADQDGRPVASALNLLGSDAIFGRYWGCVRDIPFLHFELCYYRAIDFAITHGLSRVEAGAQGEHKLLRGYEPAPTHSTHLIAHAGLREAVAHYLDRETPAMLNEIEALDGHTPFRKCE